jgi:hypothetical protein
MPYNKALFSSVLCIAAYYRRYAERLLHLLFCLCIYRLGMGWNKTRYEYKSTDHFFIITYLLSRNFLKEAITKI